MSACAARPPRAPGCFWRQSASLRSSSRQRSRTTHRRRTFLRASPKPSTGGSDASTRPRSTPCSSRPSRLHPTLGRDRRGDRRRRVGGARTRAKSRHRRHRRRFGRFHPPPVLGGSASPCRPEKAGRRSPPPRQPGQRTRASCPPSRCGDGRARRSRRSGDRGRRARRVSARRSRDQARALPLGLAS